MLIFNTNYIANIIKQDYNETSDTYSTSKENKAEKIGAGYSN